MRAGPLFRALLWGLLGLVVAAHVAGGWYFSGELIERAFTPAPGVVERPAGDYDLVEVTYGGPLGEMDAWHLPASGDTWVVHVHGKGATPAEVAHLFGPLHEGGYPQLSISYRNDEGQPLDPSGFYTYGVSEWEDVAAAVELAEANGARGVVLNGMSTGAAHVLAYAYRHDLDLIRGLMLDSPNLDMSDTVDFQAEREPVPLLPIEVPWTVTQVAKFFTSLRMGVNWQAIDYVESAGTSLRVPVLVHHGFEDETVPVRQSEALAQARPEMVRLHIVEGAGHTEPFDVDPEGYVERVLTFLDQLG